MVVIFDAHPAVVQTSGDFKYFQILPRKFMEHPKLFEQLNGKMHDVLDVFGVAVVISHQRFEAVTENVGNRLFERHGQSLIEHDALAKSRAADGELVDIHIRHERFDDRHRGGHDVGARGGKPP